MKANSSDSGIVSATMTARANADQEKDQNDQHQDHAAKQVGFDGIGGQLHQFAAIVIRMDLYIRRQYRTVQLFRLGFHGLQNVLRLLAAKHQDYAFDGVIVLLVAKLA